MKSKNLVSLSVAAVFFVLSITGLLIYFGQGGYIVDHTHAWFGVLFFIAAVFHIVNNWASIVGYSKNRRTGSIQKELIVPVIIVAIFVAGIGFDVPVFKKLGNAGKDLVRGERPRRGQMPQPTVDSIANAIESAYATAYTKGDTGALAAIMPAKTTLLTEAGTILSGSDVQKNILKRTAPEVVKAKVDRAEALDERTILVYGTSTNSTATSPSVYSHILKEQDKKWQIIAAQRAFPSVQ